MANNLKSFITVKGNEEVIKLIDSLVDKGNDSKDDSVIAFATTFYDEVDLTEGGVKNDWSYDNIGTKWTTFCDMIDEGEFSIESATKTIAHIKLNSDCEANAKRIVQCVNTQQLIRIGMMKITMRFKWNLLKVFMINNKNC